MTRCREGSGSVQDKAGVRRREGAIKNVVEEDTFPSLFQFYHLWDDCIHTLPERYWWNRVRQKKRMLTWTSAEKGHPLLLTRITFTIPSKNTLIFFINEKDLSIQSVM